MTRTLIKNANVVTMDPQLGDIERGDILVEDEKILDVGRNIEAHAGTTLDGQHWIVIPGMVNAHIHTWEFQLRGIGSDWVGSRDYHRGP